MTFQLCLDVIEYLTKHIRWAAGNFLIYFETNLKFLDSAQPSQFGPAKWAELRDHQVGGAELEWAELRSGPNEEGPGRIKSLPTSAGAGWEAHAAIMCGGRNPDTLE